MPNCNDQQRARLIYSAARRCSLVAAERLLERAIAQRDSSTIKTATAMIDHALSVKADPYEGYIRIDKHARSVTDAFYSTKKGEALRPIECRESDCPSCFWRSWCEAKEHFDIMKEVDRTIQRSKDLLREQREPKQKQEDTSNVVNEFKATLHEYETRHGEGSSRNRRRRVRVHHSSDSPPKKWVNKRENN